MDRPFGVVRRLFRIIGNVVAVCLQFLDRSDQLRNRGADIGQLDDVGLWRLGQLAQVGKLITDALLFGQVLRETGENAACERDIAQLDVDAGGSGESLNDGQKRVRRQCRRFVGFGVDNGAHGHPRGEKSQNGGDYIDSRQGFTVAFAPAPSNPLAAGPRAA